MTISQKPGQKIHFSHLIFQFGPFAAILEKTEPKTSPLDGGNIRRFSGPSFLEKGPLGPFMRLKRSTEAP